MINFRDKIKHSAYSYAQKFNNSRCDYINIGSTGFAQLGEPNYEEKLEKEVRLVIKTMKELYALKELPIDIYIEYMPNEHDFGVYHECIAYWSNSQMDNLEETNPEAYEKLWEFLNELESFDFDAIEEQLVEENVPVIHLRKQA